MLALFSILLLASSAPISELEPSEQSIAEEVRTRFIAWPRSTFLKCTPILLDDTAHKFPVACSLLAQPHSEVVVFIEAYGLKFSSCNLIFTATNWNTPQSFNVIPVPDLFATLQQSQLTIVTLAHSATESYSNTTQLLTVTKTATANRKPVTCNIVGDPHIFAFDSDASVIARTHKRAIHLDFYYTGVYYLVESRAGLRILGSYFDCAHDLTCLGGISVQYGLATYIVSVETKKWSDSLKVSSIGSTTAGTSYVIDTHSKIMTLALEDGTIIHITYGTANGVIAFDILLSPIHYTKVGGHCHYYDDTLNPEKLYCKERTWNKWGKDGKWFDQESVDEWGRCWGVKDSENVFKGRVGAVQGLPVVEGTVPMVCRVPELRVPVSAPSTPASPPTYHPCDYKNGGCASSVTASSSALTIASAIATTSSVSSTTMQVIGTSFMFSTSMAATITPTTVTSTSSLSTSTPVSPTTSSLHPSTTTDSVTITASVLGSTTPTTVTSTSSLSTSTPASPTTSSLHPSTTTDSVTIATSVLGSTTTTTVTSAFSQSKSTLYGQTTASPGSTTTSTIVPTSAIVSFPSPAQIHRVSLFNLTPVEFLLASTITSSSTSTVSAQAASNKVTAIPQSTMISSTSVKTSTMPASSSVIRAPTTQHYSTAAYTTTQQPQATLLSLLVPPQSYTPTCSIKQQDALSWCSKSIQQVQGCTTLCDRTRYIDMCISDVLSLCSYVFCDDFKSAYIRQCAVKSTLLENHPLAVYAVLATAVQQSIGFGGYACSNECGVNGGVCGEYGCACPDGKSGLDCGTDLKLAVHVGGGGLFAASGDNQTVHSVLIGGESSVYEATPQYAVSGSVRQSVSVMLLLAATVIML